jgi:MFS family permease
MIDRPRLFYGWIMVGVCILSLTLIYGTRHSFSVFFSYILDEFGRSRGSTAIMFSLSILVYGLFAPVVGGLGDRWKPKKAMLMGMAFLAITIASCGCAQKLWHFYVLFGVLVPMGMALSGWPLFAPTLANWFEKNRGMALGLGQIGGGISFSYGVVVEFIISLVGWRHAYFVQAGILVVFLLPIYLLLFHYRPEDKGLGAYGAAELTALKATVVEGPMANETLSHDWTLAKAMRTYQLWLLVLSYFLFWGISNYLVLAHQVKFAEDMGYSKIFAASIFALFGVFMVVGLLSAFVSDAVGREKTISLAAILNISAVIALVSVRDTSQPWLLYLYAICFGCGTGLYSPAIVAGTADIFHGRHFGSIAGLLLTGMGLGGAIGPWLGGFLHDISGSYTSAFILCTVCFALASAAVWIAAPRNAARLRARV